MIMHFHAAGNGLPGLPGWPVLPEISWLKGEMSGLGGQMLGRKGKRMWEEGTEARRHEVEWERWAGLRGFGVFACGGGGSERGERGSSCDWGWKGGRGRRGGEVVGERACVECGCAAKRQATDTRVEGGTGTAQEQRHRFIGSFQDRGVGVRRREPAVETGGLISGGPTALMRGWGWNGHRSRSSGTRWH
jgi:hypothetical protein